MKYTERIYSDSEIKLINEIFDMYMKRIYDEDLNDLIIQCKEMFLDNQRLMKENKRLNNIINEFDKLLFGELQTYGGGGFVQEYYDKLQKLKEGNKK